MARARRLGFSTYPRDEDLEVRRRRARAPAHFINRAVGRRHRILAADFALADANAATATATMTGAHSHTWL